MTELIGTDARPVMPLPDLWVDEADWHGKIMAKADETGNFVCFYFLYEDGWKEMFRFPLFSSIRRSLVRGEEGHG